VDWDSLEALYYPFRRFEIDIHCCIEATRSHLLPISIGLKLLYLRAEHCVRKGILSKIAFCREGNGNPTLHRVPRYFDTLLGTRRCGCAPERLSQHP